MGKAKVIQMVSVTPGGHHDRVYFLMDNGKIIEQVFQYSRYSSNIVWDEVVIPEDIIKDEEVS